MNLTIESHKNQNKTKKATSLSTPTLRVSLTQNRGPRTTRCQYSLTSVVHGTKDIGPSYVGLRDWDERLLDSGHGERPDLPDVACPQRDVGQHFDHLCARVGAHVLRKYVYRNGSERCRRALCNRDRMTIVTINAINIDILTICTVAAKAPSTRCTLLITAECALAGRVTVWMRVRAHTSATIEKHPRRVVQ